MPKGQLVVKRSKWCVQKTKVIPKVIRDSEFSEILADLGRLIYDDFCSLPDSKKSIDPSIASIPVEISSAINKKRVANE